MAVEIPKLNRLQPSQSLPKNDRINVQVRDQGSAILNQTQAVASLGNEVMDIYQQYENDKIEQVSSVAQQRYSEWNSEKLRRLKEYKGDPTDAYAEYEEEAKVKRDEILNERPDLNDRVKRHVTSRLDKTVGNENIKASYQRGQQQEVYANNVFEADVANKKKEITVSAGYVRAGDASSYDMFNAGLSDITQTIVKRGFRSGIAKELPDDAKSWNYSYKEPDEMTEDGVLIEGRTVKVALTPLAKQRIAKETSEAVNSSIEVLIAGGQIEEAKEMREKYKGYIDPKSSSKLEKKFTTAGRKEEAYKFINSLPRDPAKQIEAINNISDPELKSEVLKQKNTDDSRIAALKDRMVKTNRELMMKDVAEGIKNGTINGMSDVEETPIYKSGVWDKLDVKSQKTIEEMVETPKTSAPKSLAKINELFANDEGLENLSYEDFYHEYLSGLSKGDRSKWSRRFEKLKDPSMYESRSAIKEANGYLKRYMIQEGKIKEGKFGEMKSSDKAELYEYQDKLVEYFNSRSTLPTREATIKYVKELAADKIKQDMKKAPASETPKGKPTMAVLDGLSALERVRYQNDFKKENGFTSVPSLSDPRFLLFVEEKRKR